MNKVGFGKVCLFFGLRSYPDNLSQIMTQTISGAEALAFMFASTFSVPCLMALSATYKESHSLINTVEIR